LKKIKYKGFFTVELGFSYTIDPDKAVYQSLKYLLHNKNFSLLSSSASPACDGRKIYHKEEYLKFLFKMSIYKKY
jgi:hypothetical protein